MTDTCCIAAAMSVIKLKLCVNVFELAQRWARAND